MEDVARSNLLALEGEWEGFRAYNVGTGLSTDKSARRNMVKYLYPAIFSPEPEGGYGVVFPDLPGCVTCGDSLADAIEMGRDALAMWLCDTEDKHEPIPPASAISKVSHDSDSFVSLIDVDTIEYRRENENRAVKKTLTIPGWLNAYGEKAGINFSQLLQDALKQHLGIDEPHRSRHAKQRQP